MLDTLSDSSVPTDNAMVELYNSVHRVLNTLGDGRFADTRERGILRFAEQGLPTMADEEFRYVNLRHLTATPYQLAYGATLHRSDVPASVSRIDAITVCFVNGQFAPELSDVHSMPEGTFVGPVSELPAEFDAIFEEHFARIATLTGKLGSTNDERFVHLNSAFFADVAVIIVPAKTVIEKPIHVLHLATEDQGPFLCAPRVIAIFGARSEAKLVESYVGLKGQALIVPVTEVWVGREAIVEHVRFQDETGESTHVGTTSVHQEPQSSYTSCVANFGAKVGRLDLNVWLGGSHTETRLDGVNVGAGEQTLDNHTRIDHALPECNSFEVYKSVLRDRAQGVFNGKIFVYEDAQKTDAKQTNQALLLSATATMNSKPQLEIFADDVKCTHGATIGQLRADALFYLQARGIPKMEAESLLVYAFANDVLSRISIADVREALEARLFEKLAADVD